MWNTTLAAGKNFYLCLCDWLRFCSPFSAWPANQSWPCLPARWSKVLAIPDSIPWWIAAPAAPVAYRMTGAHTKQVVWVYVWVRVSQSYWQTKSKRRRRRLERHQMNSLLKGHVVRPRGTGHGARGKCQVVPSSTHELCMSIACSPKCLRIVFTCFQSTNELTCAFVGCAPPWNSIVPYASVGCGRVCFVGSHRSPGEPLSMPAMVWCVICDWPQQHLVEGERQH